MFAIAIIIMDFIKKKGRQRCNERKKNRAHKQQKEAKKILNEALK